MVLSPGAAFAKDAIIIKADDEVKKGDSRTEQVDPNNASHVTTTELKSQMVTMTVDAKNSSTETISGQLEVYYISENAESGDKKVSGSEKKTVTIAPGAAIKETFTPKTFSVKKVSKVTYDGSSEKTTGETYETYIILLKVDGKIIGKASQSSRYLKDEWLAKCK
jgi:hypothetical protein